MPGGMAAGWDQAEQTTQTVVMLPPVVNDGMARQPLAWTPLVAGAPLRSGMLAWGALLPEDTCAPPPMATGRAAGQFTLTDAAPAALEAV